jgi:hypothetical protein
MSGGHYARRCVGRRWSQTLGRGGNGKPWGRRIAALAVEAQVALSQRSPEPPAMARVSRRVMSAFNRAWVDCGLGGITRAAAVRRRIDRRE